MLTVVPVDGWEEGLQDTPVSPEVSVHGSEPIWAETGQRLFGIFQEGCRE